MEHMLYAKSICWIDDCRIPFVDENDKKQSVPGGKVSYTNESWGQQAGLEKDLQPKREPNTQGRFPANILVCDDMLNDGVISKSTPRTTCNRRTNGELTFGFKSDSYSPTNDKGTNSRYYDIDKWFENLLEL